MPSFQIFGDSIAHGGGDLAFGGWPMRLRRHMRLHHLGDHVFVRAVGGHTSFDLCRRMPSELGLCPSETILIAIGTNDAQVLGDAAHPRTTDAEFAGNLRDMLRLAKSYARWVVPLTPTQVNRQPRPGPRPVLPERIEALGNVVAAVAEEHGCWWIDLREVLDDHCRPDGIHPDENGHARIASTIWRALLPTGCLGPDAGSLPPL